MKIVCDCGNVVFDSSTLHQALTDQLAAEASIEDKADTLAVGDAVVVQIPLVHGENPTTEAVYGAHLVVGPDTPPGVLFTTKCGKCGHIPFHVEFVVGPN